MSLLDELKQEVAKRNPLYEKREQLEALRDKAQGAFKEQFLTDASDAELIAFLKGRIAAFDECLELFMSEEEKAQAQDQQNWADEDS